MNGADGEQYRSPVSTGTGNWVMAALKLSDFTPSSVWGNQSGNKVLDLKGIESVELDLTGNQGAGDLRIRNIVFSLFSNRGEVRPVVRQEGQPGEVSGQRPAMQGYPARNGNRSPSSVIRR